MANISVLIVDQGIEARGVLANASFVLGLTCGRLMPEESFGPDVRDGEGHAHKYLTRIAHFVRKAGQNKIRALRQEFRDDPEITIVDYTEDAAPSDYETYTQALCAHSGEQIVYRAIHFYGPEEKLYPKTKNLSSL